MNLTDTSYMYEKLFDTAYSVFKNKQLFSHYTLLSEIQMKKVFVWAAVFRQGYLC